MAHHISGFIAPFDFLCEASTRFPGSRVTPLDLGFGFLPITKHLVDDDEPGAFEQLKQLTPRLAAWAKRESRRFPLAYIETEYFCGVGGQAAIAWVCGKVVFGPISTPDLELGGRILHTALKDRAINRALRHLEVDRGFEEDEFDALGLGRYPSNEAWLTESVLV
jgi:hypothetical protein